MGTLRRWVFAIIASLVFFSIIHLVEWNILPEFQAHPGVFVVVSVAVLITFLLPPRLHTHLYYLLLFSGIISVAAPAAFGEGTFSDSLPMAVSFLVIEVGFAAWLIYAAHHVSIEIRVYEEDDRVIRMIGMEDPSLDIQAAHARIQSEVTRSRHYERPFSVFIIDTSRLPAPEGFDAVANSFSKGIGTAYSRARLARMIQRELPPMVLLIKDPDHPDNLVLVSPEIAAEIVPAVSRHLASIVQRDFGVPPEISSASFPDHGISFEALYQGALENLLNKASEKSEREVPGKQPELESERV